MVPQPGYGDDSNSTVSINVVLLPAWSVQVLARMVNFHDPAELIRDFGACLRPSAPGARNQSAARPFPSDTQGPLARRKWPVYVGLPCFSGLRASPHLTNAVSLAGSSSLLLITSGVSYKGVVPTGGRYGYGTK